jgi:hypothetical protein
MGICGRMKGVLLLVDLSMLDDGDAFHVSEGA